MKNIKLILSIGLMILFTNCSNIKNKENGGSTDGGKPKQYSSAADAANAAKTDMMAAMEKGVNFGVDKEKLKNSTPGEPVMTHQVDMKALLSADSTTSFEKISKNEGSAIIPLVNEAEVVAVITLNNNNNQFTVTGLGDKMVSKELNMISRMNKEMKGNVKIIQVDNLSATVYEVRGPNGNMYYSSYNGSNVTLAMKEAEILRLLKADALIFEKKFGEKLKKQQLVK